MGKENNKKSGLATAGMVLGIIAIPGAWIPFFNVISIILGALAFIFGIIPLVKKKSVGKSVTAVVLGALAVIIGINMTIAATKSIDDAINSGDDSSSEQVKSEDSKDKKRLTLDKGWKLDKSNPYMTQVSGTVSNNSDKDIKGYIQVTFSAYDSDGANVGDCLDNANTVDANGKWKFKAMCSGENISKVKFKEISGF